jgi:hypothetical protein
MAAQVMTYDSLVQDVIRYMERNDESFVEQIPRLIMLAEQEIATQVKTLWQLSVVETTLLVGSQGQVLEKPARWRKTVSMKVNGQPIQHRSQDYVAQFGTESNPGVPQYYADYDYNHWLFAPVPNLPYSIEIVYFERVQPLELSNQQNLITREAPQALLFGTLLQAQGYLKNDNKLAVWKQYYDTSMAALKNENNSRNVDRNTSIMEP